MTTFESYKPSEDDLQIYTADLFRSFGRPGVVGFHVPNQNMAAVQYRVKLKKFGVLPGVADWVFILPGGLARFLELKDDEGRQSSAQGLFEAGVTALGAPYAIARTVDEIDGVLSAWDVISKPVSKFTEGERVGA